MTTTASANPNGVFLPAPPRGPGGEDSVETANGTKCRQSINSNGAYLDMGVSASAASPLPEDQTRSFIADRDREGLVYMRVTVPLGKKPKRIDCSKLYKLEIERLREELALLKMAAE